jgi:hypothetical protein
MSSAGGRPSAWAATTMLNDAVRRRGIDLAASDLIGHRLRSVEAGQVTGTYSIEIEQPYGAQSRANTRTVTLAEAVAPYSATREEQRAWTS